MENRRSHSNSREKLEQSLRPRGQRRGLFRGRGCVYVRFGIIAKKGFFALCSKEKENFTMPPRRRDMQTPDLPEEREILERRGRQMLDPAMAREMHDLCARLEDMETAQRHTIGIGDLSDSESENEVEHEEEEVSAEDVANECLIRVVSRMGARAKMDILVYEGNLDVEELLDWIRSLDTYFDYEDVEEDKKVKHAVTRLKGHAALWWDELQADRRCRGK
jgi:hypothetical protein